MLLRSLQPLTRVGNDLIEPGVKFLRRYPGMWLTGFPVGQSRGPRKQIIHPCRTDVVVIDDLDLDAGNLFDALEICEENPGC